MSKTIKNTSGSQKIWSGVTIEDQASYTIPATDWSRFGYDDTVMAALALGQAQLSEDDTPYASSAEAVSALQSPARSVNVDSVPAWSAKTFTVNGVVKKIYKRVNGVKQAVSYNAGAGTTFDWECPYAWTKFMAVEICGADKGDTVSLYVVDRSAGNAFGAPFYAADLVLNQFGFDANLPNEFYKHASEFDADIYGGMRVRMVYKTDPATPDKTIGVNFVMNEVK